MELLFSPVTLSGRFSSPSLVQEMHAAALALAERERSDPDSRCREVQTCLRPVRAESSDELADGLLCHRASLGQEQVERHRRRLGQEHQLDFTPASG